MRELDKLLRRHNGWTLPSKASVWGFVTGVFFGVLSTFLSIYFGFQSGETDSLLLNAIRAEKPTKLVVSKIGQVHMLGDDEPFLLVTLHNETNRPALQVRTSVYVNGRRLDLSYTNSSNVYRSPNLAVPAYGDLEIPVGSKSELERALSVQCIRRFTQKAQAAMNNHSGNYQSKSFLLNVQYKTVFKENRHINDVVFAEIDDSCSEY